MEEKKATENRQFTVVDVQFRSGQKVYYFNPAGKFCKAGEAVVVDTARGPEYGICLAGNHSVDGKKVTLPLRPVIRKATWQDKAAVEANRETEANAYQACVRQIEAMKLDMQLVNVECSFDGSKLLFFFTADERVDFRELVKNLAAIYHTRIELRQIGVRDKARMVGGLGMCGRPFCCATFLDDFQPVSIKMAKTQSLSLNPTKISGTCGRLMCCLKYEQDAYEHLIKTSPKVDSFVDTPDGRGTVVDINLMRQSVKVQMENEPEVTGVYKNDEIAILRSGKAKKTDAPIPQDLAPISGGKAPRRKFEREDAMIGLEAIKIRHSGVTIAEEQQHASSDKEEPNRRSRSRRHGGSPRQEQKPEPPKEQKPEPQKTQKQPNPKQKKPEPQTAPKQEQPAQPEKKKNRKNRYYRHNKPNTNA